MNILILTNMRDNQTGHYLVKTMSKHAFDVTGIDIRSIVIEEPEQSQYIIKQEIDEIPVTPSIIIVTKGMELDLQTLTYIKNKFPKASLVNWFYDVYFGDKPIWEQTEWYPWFNLFDHFFCSLKGVATKMNELGFDNFKFLDEACYIPAHKEVVCNAFQKKKYGNDLSFIGTIGLPMHKNRTEILEKLVEEGYNIDIWGQIACPEKLVSRNLLAKHKKQMVINEQHSLVCQNTLINIGIDQNVDIDLGYSARIFRVMCSGGLYLSPYITGIEKVFKINSESDELDDTQEIVVFYNENHMIKVIDELLENDDLRNTIASNGQKCVKEHHTFDNRIIEMIGEIKNGNKHIED